MYTRLFLVFASCVLLFAACTDPVYFPEGNAAAGKVVFENLQCFSCHEVVGEDYPEPTAITPTYVALGQRAKPLTRESLFESIIAPSHEFAQPRPPEKLPFGTDTVKIAGHSRMTDFSAQMTVRELIDLVAYLESLQREAVQAASLQ